MTTYIIPTTSAEHIARKLIGNKDIEVVFVDKNREGKRYFPDGEVYVGLSSINELKGRVVLLHSGAPHPNDGLIELEMLLQILKKADIHPREVFFTYFPYGQQDKIFRAGEINAAECLIKKLTTYYNVDRIYTIDAHFFGRKWLDRYPIVNISAVELLTREALRDYPNAVLVVPDKGGQRRTGMRGAAKKRKDSYTTEISSPGELKDTVKGKIVAVVDDIIETGGTLFRFYDECMTRDAKQVIVLVTHGALSEGIRRIEEKFSKLYLTNTIDRKEATIDVTPLVLKAIRENFSKGYGIRKFIAKN